jgi:hypothetical protein
MTNIDSLLSSYQALSEEHAKQTEHQFVTIRQVLDERVKEIYDASDHLLEDQCVALNRIVDTLRTDAPIKDLLRSMNHSEQEIDQLGGEMGILVFYVSKLFELKPTVSVFEYNSLKRIY